MLKTETSHFWVGRFPDEQAAEAYFSEVWDENDEDREHTPLSQFAREQGATWYDHDMMEYGFRDEAASLAEFMTDFSYSEQWAAELGRRAAEAGLYDINLLVFIRHDQIHSPRTILTHDYQLHYLGAFEYRIGAEEETP